MEDELDQRLRDAGVMVDEVSPAVTEALDRLVAARVRSPRVGRRRRGATFAVSAGVVLAVIGGGAVAASQWGPWRLVTEPDVVVSRSWTDATGTWLGDCETRIALEGLPDTVRSTAREYLESRDLDTLEPDPQAVAGALTAVGRADDLGRLLPSAADTEFDVGSSGELWPSEWWSDARILQEATTASLLHDLTEALFAAHPEETSGGIEALGETQCTTDPPAAS